MASIVQQLRDFGTHVAQLSKQWESGCITDYELFTAVTQVVVQQHVIDGIPNLPATERNTGLSFLTKPLSRDTPVYDLGFSTRLGNLLLRSGYQTLGSLIEVANIEIMGKIDNLTRPMLKELIEVLEAVRSKQPELFA